LPIDSGHPELWSRPASLASNERSEYHVARHIGIPSLTYSTPFSFGRKTADYAKSMPSKDLLWLTIALRVAAYIHTVSIPLLVSSQEFRKARHDIIVINRHPVAPLFMAMIAPYPATPKQCDFAIGFLAVPRQLFA